MRYAASIPTKTRARKAAERSPKSRDDDAFLWNPRAIAQGQNVGQNLKPTRVGPSPSSRMSVKNTRFDRDIFSYSQCWSGMHRPSPCFRMLVYCDVFLHAWLLLNFRDAQRQIERKKAQINVQHTGTCLHGRTRLPKSCTNRPGQSGTPILGSLISKNLASKNRLVGPMVWS